MAIFLSATELDRCQFPVKNQADSGKARKQRFPGGSGPQSIDWSPVFALNPKHPLPSALSYYSVVLLLPLCLSRLQADILSFDRANYAQPASQFRFRQREMETLAQPPLRHFLSSSPLPEYPVLLLLPYRLLSLSLNIDLLPLCIQIIQPGRPDVSVVLLLLLLPADYRSRGASPLSHKPI